MSDLQDGTELGLRSVPSPKQSLAPTDGLNKKRIESDESYVSSIAMGSDRCAVWELLGALKAAWNCYRAYTTVDDTSMRMLAMP